MPTKKPRITAIVEQATKDKVSALAKTKKTSESIIAKGLLETALNDRVVINGENLATALERHGGNKNRLI